MPMSAGYLNAIADSGKALITHIALVDGAGVEIVGGTYARLPVTWTAASGGTVRPSANMVFQVGAGVTVGGWRGYTAVTAGTSYGGADFTPVTFTNAGEFTLTAASSGIAHAAA